ncbi:MAG: DUF305 domain-containing protein [Polyangiaceae bacterium]
MFHPVMHGKFGAAIRFGKPIASPAVEVNSMTYRPRWIGFGMLLAVTGLCGCHEDPLGTSPDPDGSLELLAQRLGPANCLRTRDTASTIGDRRISFVPTSDLQFIDFFMVHHRDAIDIAKMVIENGADVEVKALAQHMHDAQTRELNELRSTRQRITGSGEPAPQPEDHHMMTEMQYMRSLSGAELDYAFLEEMIPHHGSGIAPARYALSHLCRFNLGRLAVEIYSAQARGNRLHDRAAEGARG